MQCFPHIIQPPLYPVHHFGVLYCGMHRERLKFIMILFSGARRSPRFANSSHSCAEPTQHQAYCHTSSLCFRGRQILQTNTSPHSPLALLGKKGMNVFLKRSVSFPQNVFYFHKTKCYRRHFAKNNRNSGMKSARHCMGHIVKLAEPRRSG